MGTLCCLRPASEHNTQTAKTPGRACATHMRNVLCVKQCVMCAQRRDGIVARRVRLLYTYTMLHYNTRQSSEFIPVCSATERSSNRGKNLYNKFPSGRCTHAELSQTVFGKERTQTSGGNAFFSGSCAFLGNILLLIFDHLVVFGLMFVIHIPRPRRFKRT